MNHKTDPLAALAGLMLLASTLATAGEAKSARTTAKSFLGDRTVSILEGAKTVEVYRIAPRKETKPGGEAIDGYPVLSRGKDRGEFFARRLAAVLLDDKTYSFDSAKGCIFSPGVVFRVPGRGGTVDVITCFSCSEFKFVTTDEKGQAVNSAGEDFDNARAAFVRLAKDAFPGDTDLRSLHD